MSSCTGICGFHLPTVILHGTRVRQHQPDLFDSLIFTRRFWAHRRHARGTEGVSEPTSRAAHGGAKEDGA
jgi:hypothetical protein